MKTFCLDVFNSAFRKQRTELLITILRKKNLEGLLHFNSCQRC
jgi:hypothetical protein